MALFDLVLTGELPGMGPADGGNVAMFAVPQKFGDRAVDESILRVRNTVPVAVCKVQLHDHPGMRKCTTLMCWLAADCTLTRKSYPADAWGSTALNVLLFAAFGVDVVICRLCTSSSWCRLGRSSSSSLQVAPLLSLWQLTC